MNPHACPGRRCPLHSRQFFVFYFILASLPFFGCAGTAPRSVDVFYPAAPDTARYQFLMRVETSADVETQSWFNRVVVGETLRRRFGKPYGVTGVGSRVFVGDAQLRLVARIDFETGEMNSFSSAGGVKFKSIINLEHDEAGNIYVCDPVGGSVVVMTQDGGLVRTYGEGLDLSPVDVAIGRDLLYVVDTKSRTVVMIDRESGESLGNVDVARDSLGFVAPTNISLGPDGSIYVVDTVNCRILHFDAEGNFLDAFGQQGFYPGEFARPKGIAVEPDGRILVVDAAFENVQVLDSLGRVYTYIGGPGQKPGSLWLPAGVARSPGLVPYLKRFSHNGAEISDVIIVASQFGPPRIDFFGRIANVQEFARAYPPEKRRSGRAMGTLPEGEKPQDVTGADLESANEKEEAPPPQEE